MPWLTSHYDICLSKLILSLTLYAPEHPTVIPNMAPCSSYSLLEMPVAEILERPLPVIRTQLKHHLLRESLPNTTAKLPPSDNLQFHFSV